jgi:hypothetical protein
VTVSWGPGRYKAIFNWVELYLRPNPKLAPNPNPNLSHPERICASRADQMSQQEQQVPRQPVPDKVESVDRKKAFYELVESVTGLMNAQVDVWGRLDRLEEAKYHVSEVDGKVIAVQEIMNLELRSMKDDLICLRIRQTELESRILELEEENVRLKQRSWLPSL